VPQPNPALPTQESGTAPAPSGLSCSPGSPVPTGSPLMLVASALGAAGAVAAAARIRDALHSSETEHL